MLCRVLCRMHAYSLPIHYAETVRNFGAVNGTVGTPRVNSATKGRVQTFISHTIQSILQVFIFGIALNLLTLHAPQCNNRNK